MIDLANIDDTPTKFMYFLCLRIKLKMVSNLHTVCMFQMIREKIYLSRKISRLSSSWKKMMKSGRIILPQANIMRWSLNGVMNQLLMKSQIGDQMQSWKMLQLQKLK